MKEISMQEMRNIQLDILQTVHDFCVRKGIRYSLAYGTLLGAVRHGGYIPWDDDIDIAMMRDDYERFANEFNHTSSYYHFYDCRNDKDVNITFGKVADTRTMVEEGGRTKNLGVSIDIFPIDDLCDTYDESRKYYKSFAFAKNILILKCREVADVRSMWKKPFFALVKLLTFWYPLHNISLKINAKAMHHRKNDSKYVGSLVSGNEKEIVERKIWSEYCQIAFENRMFYAVKDSDAYLRHAYGDYMKLPPEKDRVPKHDFHKIYWI